MAKVYIDGRAVVVNMPRGIFMCTRTNEQLQKLLMAIMSGERKDVFIAVRSDSTDENTGLTTSEYLRIPTWESLRKIVAVGGQISIQYAQKLETAAANPAQNIDFRSLLA